MAVPIMAGGAIKPREEKGDSVTKWITYNSVCRLEYPSTLIWQVINRPGVAVAVLKTPPSLIT